MAVTSQNKEKFEDYEGFVEKFKPKKTTDDCYTPTLVYDAVAHWVAREYGLKRSRFCRPFYPGWNYKEHDYNDGIVVDNPPFSILSEIIKFYVANDIKFFLFCPTLTCCRYGDLCTVLPVGVDITYENGAVICTSFVTNLEPHEIRVRVAPTLYDAVDLANKINTSANKRTVPKYVYPLDLVTTAAIYPYARYGIEFIIPRSESVRVSALDSQRASGKSVFGCGWLISERVKAEREKAEREKAEREKAERWALSERELLIIKGLNEMRWLNVAFGQAISQKAQ